MGILEDDLEEENCTGEELIVAIWEFLCFIMIATYCAARWTNKIVLYVSDNQLVQRWITNLRSRSKLANFLCGVLTLLQARFRFETFSVYINYLNKAVPLARDEFCTAEPAGRVA